MTEYLDWIAKRTKEDSEYCLPRKTDDQTDDDENNEISDEPEQPNRNNCGIKNSAPSTRMVNGVTTLPRAFPWMVMTLMLFNNSTF